MATLNSALEIGKSALRSQQIGLNVAGNNIANVNTPGYSRKMANLKPNSTIQGIGTGVNVGAITSARDRLLDSQMRFSNSSSGELEVLERAMSTVEAIFSEMAGGGATESGAVFSQPGGAALNGSFSRFFNAFQDLANNPESEATRAAVREEAFFLVEQFHRMDDQLTQLRGDLDTELVTTVENVNRLTQQIATLNVKIQSERKGPGQVAGDLEDEQGHMIDELSRLITISVRENSDGTTTISAPQGLLLVDHGVSNDLGTRAATNNGAVVSFLTQAADGRAVEPAGGHLKGLITARDEKLVNYRQSMDELAQTLVGRLNAIHAGGFGLDGSSGTNFFTSVQTSARLIDVSSEIRADLNKIAASGSATGSGDGSNALALSDLRTTKVLGSGNQTLEEFYSGLVGRVGAEARDIFTSAESQRLVSEQVQTRRENMRGVSINEEATSLILFQRAYQAAARIVTAVDEMMQAALNM